MGIPAPLGVAASGAPNSGDQANAHVTGTFTAIGPGKPFAFRGALNVTIWATATTTLTTTKGSLSASVASGTGIAAGQSVNSTLVPKGTTWGAFAGTTGTLALPPLTFYGSNFSTSSQNITLPPGSNVAQLVGATVTRQSNAFGLTLAGGTTVLSVVQNDIAPSANDPTGTPGIVQLSAAPTVVPPNNTPVPLEFALTATAIGTSGSDAAAVFQGASLSYVATVQIERSFNGGSNWHVCNIGGGGSLAQYSAGTPVSLSFGEPESGVLYRLNCIAYTSGTINYRMSATGAAAQSISIPTL